MTDKIKKHTLKFESLNNTRWYERDLNKLFSIDCVNNENIRKVSMGHLFDIVVNSINGS